jgi:hypothetical protein
VERARAGGRFAVRVPEFSRDVHDLAGLAAVAGHLFRESPGA